MSFNDYDLYDNKSVESLTKEFKRTQHEIKDAVVRNQSQKYNMLFLYRQEIRRLIKEKENAKESNRTNTIRNNDTNNTNSSN